MKIFKIKKTIMALSGIALLSVTVLVVSSCSNDYYRASTASKRIYYHPHDYYYYPNLSVYFHISSGYYYYREGVDWRRVRTLPSRYFLDSRNRVRIVINSNIPYIKHNTHKLKYTGHPNYRVNKKRNLIERKNNSRRYRNNRRR